MPATLSFTREQIARCLDHSLLRPDMTPEEVVKGCAVAAACGTASVCVKPCDVGTAYALLSGTPVAVSTVIGFPHGSTTTATKVAEAREALAGGCTELDMVLNIGSLRSGTRDGEVEADIRAVCDVAHGEGARVKVILENAYLTDAEKVRGVRLAEAAGADWVKTSTGFAGTGSTPADLRLMRATAGLGVQVKAAGGLRTLDAVLEALACGVTRVGATATLAILAEFDARLARQGGAPGAGMRVEGEEAAGGAGSTSGSNTSGY